MDDSISRVLVKTMVRKAIKDIKETPERSTRNLVDLALNFSDGRFQKEFFRTAQRMLADENSAYYDLIRDVLSYADEEKLLTFGMNLGYNGCTAGAEKIRAMERLQGIFSILIPETSCPREVREQVYETVIRARMEQKYRTIVWELYQDALMVDRIISEDGCWLAFDEQGNPRVPNQSEESSPPNLFRNDLKQILQAAFPKERSALCGDKGNVG